MYYSGLFLAYFDPNNNCMKFGDAFYRHAIYVYV